MRNTSWYFKEKEHIHLNHKIHLFFNISMTYPSEKVPRVDPTVQIVASTLDLTHDKSAMIMVGVLKVMDA